VLVAADVDVEPLPADDVDQRFRDLLRLGQELARAVRDDQTRGLARRDQGVRGSIGFSFRSGLSRISSAWPSIAALGGISLSLDISFSSR
jgi:hypothetical protein